MSVVIASVDVINDLLTSLELLVNSDVPMLNIDPSPTDSAVPDTNIGMTASFSEYL